MRPRVADGVFGESDAQTGPFDTHLGLQSDDYSERLAAGEAWSRVTIFWGSGILVFW